MAALWSLLFPSGSRIEPESLQECVPHDPSFRAETAVFGWMDAMRVAVAWYPTRDAEERATREGLALTGPDPEVVGRVHDKAFAEAVARRSGLVPPALRDSTLVLDAELLRDAAPSCSVTPPAASQPSETRSNDGPPGRTAVSSSSRVCRPVGAGASQESARPSTRTACAEPSRAWRSTGVLSSSRGWIAFGISRSSFISPRADS
jgi:hypothetical protein